MVMLVTQIFLIAVIGSFAVSAIPANHDPVSSGDRFVLNSDSLKELTLVDIALEFQRAYPDEVRAALRPLMQNDDGTLNEDGSLMIESLYGILENTSRCQICVGLMALLKAGPFYNDTTYQIFKPKLITVCEMLAERLRIRGDPLCKGAIDLQFPHLFEVLKNREVTDPDNVPGIQMCQFLNNCPTANTNNQQTGLSEFDPLKHLPAEESQKMDWKTNERVAKSLIFIPPENSIKVVQLTDIHLEPDYTIGTNTNCGLPVCCVPTWGEGTAGRFGDYRCNIPRRTIEVFLEKVKSFKPDLVLFSGDVPPHAVWDETDASQKDCSETLVDTLRKNLSNYRVYPNIGNHEMYPTNLFSIVKTTTLNTTSFVNWFTDLWAPVANFSPDDITNIRAGGYYTKLVREKLRIVSFNSNYMYTFNWYNVYNHKLVRGGGIPGARPGEYDIMKQFVEGALQAAANNYEKVILLFHHPPGGSDYMSSASRWYSQLILQYKDIIVLQPCGHTHFDEFRMIYNGTVPSSVVYVSPSMTSYDMRNPSMRVFYLDNSTYEVLDYEQYFMDIGPATFAATPPPVDWTNLVKLLYSARNEYGLQDMSPASWDDLLDRFKTDTSLLRRHRSHHQADAQGNLAISTCGPYCLGQHICRMRNVNYDQYQTCVEKLPPRFSEITLPTNVPRPTNPPLVPDTGSRAQRSIVSLFSGVMLIINIKW